MRAFIALISVLLCALPCQAALPLDRLDHAVASLESDTAAIAPGAQFQVSLRLQLETGWHTYTKDPGDAGLPTRIEWTLPEGFKAGEIIWPPAKTFDEAGITTYGYENEVTLPSPVTAPMTISAGESYTLSAQVDFMVCKDICIPQTTALSLTLPGADKPPSPTATPAATGSPASLTFAAALMLSLLGGALLNFMPCVFPVLSLKALKLARYSGKERLHVRMEGIAYTLGIMLSFAVIAGLLLTLKIGGEAIGWGYQMQSAAFVGTLALLLFAIGLNLSGFFELPVLFGSVDLEQMHPHSLKKSFFTGVLATLVATPCTAPFMASAIGYSLTLPPYAALAVFEVLAFGLALPFLGLSFFPRLLAFLPKPGAWMVTFREALAFPMYASAVWLIWVLTIQTGANGAAISLLSMLGLTLALWLQKRSQAFVPLVFLSMIILGNGWLLYRLDQTAAVKIPAAAHGEPFSQTALDRLRAAGTPVFVDATAAWCITCQINYQTTLGTERITQAFKEKHITLMVADWTRKDAHITEFLNRFDHNGVPLYVYFPPHGEPKILPQILTPTLVLEAIQAP